MLFSIEKKATFDFSVKTHSTSSSVAASLLAVALHPEGTGKFTGSPSPMMRIEARVRIGIQSDSSNPVPAGFGGS